MIHLNVVVGPAGIKAKIGRKNMCAPTLEACLLHQLSSASLGFHDLLKRRAFFQRAISQLVRLPIVAIIPWDAAVGSRRVEHGYGAAAGTSRLH